MKAIIGLGNPGSEYQNTRHNLGQQIITQFLKKNGLNLQNSPKINCQTCKIEDSILAITTTYMNLSGPAVNSLISYYKITPDDLYVIHDDLDLRVGEWRQQIDRGPAGHNGIKSIIEALGTQNFHRIRVGIDHPRNSANSRMPVEDYVLLPFTPDEQVIIGETIDKIVAELKVIVNSGS